MEKRKWFSHGVCAFDTIQNTNRVLSFKYEIDFDIRIKKKTGRQDFGNRITIGSVEIELLEVKYHTVALTAFSQDLCYNLICYAKT